MLLTIAGQTAGSKWLNFFEGTQGYLFYKFFFKIRFFKMSRTTQVINMYVCMSDHNSETP